MRHIWAYAVVSFVPCAPSFHKNPKNMVVNWSAPSQSVHHRLRSSTEIRGALREVLQFCDSSQKIETENFPSPKELSLFRLH